MAVGFKPSGLQGFKGLRVSGVLWFQVSEVSRLRVLGLQGSGAFGVLVVYGFTI